MRRSILWFLLVGLFALSVPAQAAPTTVTLKVSLGKPSPASITRAECTVNVETGADGIAVLEAAVAKRCILSYQLQTFGNGHFVSCIDQVCGVVATYWAMRENSSYTDYGVDGFAAASGDVLWFAYEEFVTCYPLGLSC